MSSPALKPISIGLLAGLAGTIVMTLGQKLEMRLTGREGSDDPAEAVEDLTGEKVEDQRQKQALTNAVHFAYGTALGTTLAALDGVKEPARTALFFAGAWGLGALIETWLHPDQPVTQWDAQQLATDIGHHIVYAAAASFAYGKTEEMLTGE
jgi:hypothetical protein